MEKLIIVNQTEFDNATKCALVKAQCPQCNKIFERQKNYLLRSNTSYCSHKCAGEGRKETVQLTCEFCKHNYSVWPSHSNRGKHNFCSQSCNSKFYKNLDLYKKPITIIEQHEFDALPILISKEKFNSLRNNDYVLMRCKSCNNEFNQLKQSTINGLRKNSLNGGYCSAFCTNQCKVNKITLQCTECGKDIIRCLSRRNNCKNSFCSKSCTATYRNKNKDFGQIRSKMEFFIEQKIKETYPNLTLICNDRKLLNGLELDFLFPSLKLAFELNGITHYEPIYGIDRLTRSKDSDNRKMTLCHENGIELAIIDISSIKYFKEKSGLKIFEEFKKILSPLVN